MTRTPDRLHTIEAYVMMFGVALKTPHDLDLTFKILAQSPKYSRRRIDLNQPPLRIGHLLENPDKADQLAEELDNDFAQGKYCNIPDEQLRVLSYTYGIEDGRIRTTSANLGKELGKAAKTVTIQRDSGLALVRHYLGRKVSAGELAANGDIARGLRDFLRSY